MGSDIYEEFYSMVKYWTKKDYATPGIKAEVIVDMLISGFVGDIVRDGLGEDREFTLLAKEFPIKTFVGHRPPYHLSYVYDAKQESYRISSRNAKVDFLLADMENRELFLTELKSAKESFSEKQLMRMLYSAKCGIVECFDFYQQVIKDSSQPAKYGIQSKAIKEKLGIEDFENIGRAGFSRIRCLYLSLGELDDKKTYEGAKLVDYDKNELFAMSGFRLEKDGTGRERICFDEDDMTVPVIDITKYESQGDVSLWNKVKDILCSL